MSNLYKQWVTRTESTNVRVINSNAVMAEHLEKNAVRSQERGDGADIAKGGFSEGILAEAPVIEVEPEIDYVELAKSEAERILAEARAHADQMVERANEESADIRETARNQGYQEGRAKQDAEFAGLKQQLEEAYRKKEQNLAQDYQAKRSSMEKDLVDVILKVFDKVFHIQFDNKKEILIHLIDDAILNIEGEKHFRVKVAAGNDLFLENHKEEILDRVGHDVELDILSDSTMEGNDCIIETDSGVFDCSLDTQLQNLIKDIRSLCS